MLRPILPAFAAIAFMAAAASAPPAAEAQEARELRWATSAVGSAGHRALVSLATVLNREMPTYSITVLPTPGAVASVRGYATEQFDGYYGADIAFHELADGTGRFQGFREQMQREPVQSFWAYTIEVGLGVRAGDRDSYDGWRGLAGRPLFTGPAPWDVRAQLERALAILNVGHTYVELDLGLAGSSLQEGTIDGFIIYTTGETSPAPWVTEALLTAEVAALNPTDEEMAELKQTGLDVVEVDVGAFNSDLKVEKVRLVPFFYGFHVGMEVPEDDVHRMLTVIEENAVELAQADAAFNQIKDDMVNIQRRGVIATGGAVKVHPGLARYLRDKGAWDEAWNDRIASN